MSKGQVRRRPLSRRAALTLLLAVAFVILGLVGLRLHGATTVNFDVPLVAEAQMVTENTNPSIFPQASILNEVDHPIQSSLGGSHLDILAICVLTLLASIMLVVLLHRRIWKLLRAVRICMQVRELSGEPARHRPLLLLLSISRV